MESDCEDYVGWRRIYKGGVLRNGFPGGEQEKDGCVTMRPRHKENGDKNVKTSFEVQMIINVAALAGRKAAFLVRGQGIFSSRQEAKMESWLIVVDRWANKRVGMPPQRMLAGVWFLTFVSTPVHTQMPQYSPPRQKCLAQHNC